MKIYLVWYRLEGEFFDRVRGVAKNWVRAERMAETLDLHLRAAKLPVVETGVKSGIHGNIYKDEELHMRWVVEPKTEESEVKV